MEMSKLSSHKFEKGLFVTPFNTIENMKLNHWNFERLPAYLWLGLIIKKHGHTDGLEKCFRIIEFISKNYKTIELPTLNSILLLSEDAQREIYEFVLKHVEPITLAPLTLIYTFSKHPTFNKFFNVQHKIDSRKEKLVEIVDETYNHQSEISTDIRFIIVWSVALTDRLKISKDLTLIEALHKYAYCSHDDEIMKLYRPTIRSTEGVFGSFMNSMYDQSFNEEFWKEISEMTDCKLFVVNFGNDDDVPDANKYVQHIKGIGVYYEEFFRTFKPISKKAEVILSIFVYSYKRLVELVEHMLYCEISGRTIIRSLIENYIIIKYLIEEEKNHTNIWEEYMSYGLGQYKLILLKYKEKETAPKESHVPVNYIEAVLQTETSDAFLNMDTRYFDKKSIREKAILVKEKDLFDFYYDYDSQFEHGLWGAIRETTSLICDNPAHKYHHSLDINNHQKLKSVWDDSKKTMNLIVDYVNQIYPIPVKVKEYE